MTYKKVSKMKDRYYLIFGANGHFIGWTQQKYVARDVALVRDKVIVEKMYRDEMTDTDIADYLNENHEFRDVYLRGQQPLYTTFYESEVIDEGIPYVQRSMYESWQTMVKLLYSQNFTEEERHYLHLLFSHLNETVNVEYLRDNGELDSDGDEEVGSCMNMVTMFNQSDMSVLKPAFVAAHKKPTVEVRANVDIQF